MSPITNVASTTVVMVSNGHSICSQIESAWRRPPASTAEYPDSHTENIKLIIQAEVNLDDLEYVSPDLVLLVTDEPDQTFEEAVLTRCRTLNLRVLPVLGRGSAVLVGPLEIPQRNGCTTCMQLRWDYATRRAHWNSALRSRLPGINESRLVLGMTDSELAPLATMVVNEVRRGTTMLPNRLDQSVLPNLQSSELPQVGLYRRNSVTEWITLVPHHDCPRCEIKPEDDVEFADFQFESRIVEDVHSLRAHRVDFDRLQRTYVHEELGYISRVNEQRSGEDYLWTSAIISLPNSREYEGFGSGLIRSSAVQTAILEAVERVCGARATNRQPVVWGSYLDYQDVAVDPRRLGFHDDALYLQRSDLEPFDENQAYSWLWAYSTQMNKPVLIPEQVAHYGTTRDEKRFVLETSNGCALGGALEEAVLHGIFEVLERDGFLNMWYGKLPVPELVLGQNCPEDVVQSVAMMERRGYAVRLFNVSHDIGIPAIVAIAVGPEGNFPRFVTGSSCHLDPYEATRGALREMTVQVHHLENASDKRILRAREMASDSSKIQNIYDHILAAAAPESFPRWAFLLGAERNPPERQGSMQTLEDVFDGVSERYQMASRDLAVILNAVLADLHRLGFDVILVNQTNVEAASGGFHAVKAIIPGMTPITFGHGQRRVQGLQRVLELPRQLGRTFRILSVDELNPDCHPFS